MKKMLLIISLFTVCVSSEALAATSQYPNPYRQTMWNSMTDSIHTMGQNPQQANLTKMRLHALRTQARLNSIQQAQIAQRKAKMKAWQNSQS
jgi:hypothetical protein